MGKIKTILTSLILLFCSLSYADPNYPIYCPKCKKHLYNYHSEIEQGKELSIDFIESVEAPFPKQEEDFICPFDNAPLNGWEYWFWEKDLPEPDFVYYAISIYTKSGDNFFWYPEEVEMGL